MTNFWHSFTTKNESKNDAFEELSRQVFRRLLTIDDELPRLHSDPNNKGLEAKPVKINNKWYGFQAKFFEHSFSYAQLKVSIEKAIEQYKSGNDNELDVIHVFSNKSYKADSQNWKSILRLCENNKIVLNPYCNYGLIDEINNAQYYDLLQIYFGRGDELGFIKNQLNSKRITEIQNYKQFEIPLKNFDKVITLDEIKISVLENIGKIHILTGHAGSGKTIIAQTLFYKFSGFEIVDTSSNPEKTQKNILKTIAEQGLIPVYVSFKDCCTDITLEVLIRNRQKDYSIRNNLGYENLEFAYILDGLDEIPSNKIDYVLNYIRQLKSSDSTKFIFTTCRKANPNLSTFKSDFRDSCVEISIANLESEYKKNFLDITDIQYTATETTLEEIKDIYTLNIFKKLSLDKNSFCNISIFELYKLQIQSLLTSVEHRKELKNLNIPNIKEEWIIEFNKELSYEFYKKFQFRFGLSDLQSIAERIFPKLSYQDINELIDYNSGLFFDTNNGNNETSFIYKHRKYQDYFFILKLADEYFKNRSIIRYFDLLDNPELRREFYGYLRGVYSKNIGGENKFYQGNLPKILELNLTNIYLENGENWYNSKIEFGTDDPYYLNYYNEFIYCLSLFNSKDLDELLSDENTQICNKIVPNTFTVKTFFENGHSEYANKLFDEFKSSHNSQVEILNNPESTNDEKNQATVVSQDLVGNVYDFLWLVTKYLPENTFDLLKYAREFKASELVSEIRSGNLPSQLHSVIEFFLDHEYFNLFEKLIESQDHLIIFCEVLSQIKYIHIVLNDEVIKKLLKAKLIKFSSINNYSTLFWKELLDIEYYKPEINKIERRGERDYELSFYQSEIGVHSFLTDEFNGKNFDEKYLKWGSGQVQTYRFLFFNYINYLQGKIDGFVLLKNLMKISYQRSKQSSDLLTLFILGLDNTEIKVKCFKYIVQKEYILIDQLLFRLKKYKESELFEVFFRESVVSEAKSKLDSWAREWPEYVEFGIQSSMLAVNNDPQEAKKILKKTLSHTRLRHGWRKDIIVSSHLNEALDFVWKNKTYNQTDLESYSDRVLRLNLLLDARTDGKGTHWGKNEFLKIISNYDLDLAKKYFVKNRLFNDNETYEFRVIIILSLIENNYDIEAIKSWLKEFNQSERIMHNGKLEESYIYSKLIIYNKIIENPWIDDDYKNEKLIEIKEFIEFVSEPKYTVEYSKELEAFSKKYNLNLKFKEISKKEKSNTPSMKDISISSNLKKIFDIITKNKADDLTFWRDFAKSFIKLPVNDTNTQLLVQFLEENL